MVKKLIMFLLFLLAISNVSAATIHGSVYDVSLKKVKNTIIEVNSTPMQRVISVDGTYSFNLPKGSYSIKAVLKEQNETTASTLETINIEAEGNYVLDLMVFPSFEAEQELLNETELEITNELFVEQSYIMYYIIGIIIFFILITLFVLYYKKLKLKKPAEKEDISEILEFIRKHNNRVTQKEIRQNFPQSEAKISLMIAELEQEGKIKKIKKGRGNIIIMK